MKRDLPLIALAIVAAANILFFVFRDGNPLSMFGALCCSIAIITRGRPA